MSKIKDCSHPNVEADHVICNWCGEEMLVDWHEDECPCCHQKGFLMDIK